MMFRNLKKTEDQVQLESGSRRLALPTLCGTRWLSRGDTISSFLANIEAIYEASDEIRTSSTSQQSSADAQSYMRALEQFSFIYIAVVTQYLLAFIRPLSVALQSKSCNLVEAHDNAQELIGTIENVRSDNQIHDMLFERSVTFGSKIGVEPQKPRSATRQRHRANAGAVDQPVSQYFIINVFFPFVDHILTHLRERFPPEVRDVMLGSYLIPSKLNLLTPEIEVTLKEAYADELPAPTEFEQELLRWKTKWNMSNAKPDSLNQTLNKCNDAYFPNISSMLQLLLSLPIGSVACERSFSALMRLKTWSRTSMGEKRLNGLSLLFIHRHDPAVRNMDPVQILKKWDASGHRRIALAFD